MRQCEDAEHPHTPCGGQVHGEGTSRDATSAEFDLGQPPRRQVIYLVLHMSILTAQPLSLETWTLRTLRRKRRISSGTPAGAHRFDVHDLQSSSGASSVRGSSGSTVWGSRYKCGCSEWLASCTSSRVTVT